MINNSGKKKYSRIIQLNRDLIDFEIDNVINPFTNELSFNIITNSSTKVNAELIDLQGKHVKQNNYLVYPGVNSMRIENTGFLSPGIYTLRISDNEKVISRKVMKKN